MSAPLLLLSLISEKNFWVLYTLFKLRVLSLPKWWWPSPSFKLDLFDYFYLKVPSTGLLFYYWCPLLFPDFDKLPLFNSDWSLCKDSFLVIKCLFGISIVKSLSKLLPNSLFDNAVKFESCFVYADSFLNYYYLFIDSY